MLDENIRENFEPKSIILTRIHRVGHDAQKLKFCYTNNYYST